MLHILTQKSHLRRHKTLYKMIPCLGLRQTKQVLKMALKLNRCKILEGTWCSVGISTQEKAGIAFCYIVTVEFVSQWFLVQLKRNCLGEPVFMKILWLLKTMILILRTSFFKRIKHIVAKCWFYRLFTFYM